MLGFFLHSDLVFCKLASFPITFISFFLDCLGFSTWTVISSAIKRVVFLPLLLGYFISFSCLIALARTSSPVGLRTRKREPPCLVPDLSRKGVVFHH